MATDDTDPTIEKEDTTSTNPTTVTKSSSRKKALGTKKRKNGKEPDSTDAEKAPRKKKAPTHQVQTERDEIPKLWDKQKAAESGSYSKFFATFYIFHRMSLN